MLLLRIVRKFAGKFFLFLSMKKHCIALCMVIWAVGAMVSCVNNDNEEATLYDDTAITSFSLTSGTQYKHTLSSKGEDSVYTVSANTILANCSFSIDHYTGLITNKDSLPVGIDASKLLCSVSTYHNGVPYLVPLEAGPEMVLQATDTVSFLSERKVRVVSTNGQNSRIYTVKVNVHKEEGDEFTWHRMGVLEPIRDAELIESALLGDRLLVFALKGSATEVYAVTAGAPDTWEKLEAGLTAQAINSKGVVRGDTLFVADGGKVMCSLDGLHYETLATGNVPVAILGKSTCEIYGQSAEGLPMVSTDGGRTWSTDAIAVVESGDEERLKALLPTHDMDFTCIPHPALDSADYVLMAGNRNPEQAESNPYRNDRYGKVWRKVADYGINARPGQWVCMNETEEKPRQLPRMDNLQIFGYDNMFLAFGGEGIGPDAQSAYNTIYESRDGGLTWKASARCTWPTAMDKGLRMLSVSVDIYNNVWFVCSGTGEVWKGRLNRLGWE